MNGKNSVNVIMNIRRLSNIRRYNTVPTVQTYTVAAHSYQVAIIAHILAKEYNEWVEKHNSLYHPLDIDNQLDTVDVNATVYRALYHDIEECLMSDIPWTVKHANPNIEQQIHQVSADKLNSLYANSNCFWQKNIVVNAKSGLEGEIVALADILDCALEVYTDYHLGNRYIGHILKQCMQIINNTKHLQDFITASPTLRELIHMLESFNRLLDSQQAHTGSLPADLMQ